MLAKFGEFKKLVQVFGFISGQAIESMRGRRRSSHLLTELYLDALGEQSRLPRRSLTELFPAIGSSVFTVFGKAHPFITEGFADREAFTSSNETCALASITSCLAPKNILEFGTARGGTTFQFFLNAPNAVIHTLDIETPKLENLAIRKAFADPRVRVVTANSCTFDFRSMGTNFNLIFIDGGHDEETVRSDSLKALEVLAPGGVILWHDYKPSFPGVFKALNELSAKVAIEHLWGTSLAIHRKN